MNLSEHFFEDSLAFVTYEELGLFCEKHKIENKDKPALVKALTSIGKLGFAQWTGQKPKKAILGLALRDPTLWGDKEFYGKGIKTWQ